MEDTELACYSANKDHSARDDIKNVFEDARNMLMLFYCHLQRVLNLQKRIISLFESVRAETAGQPESVIVLINYKMKFESIRYKGKTVEFFKKRGRSWHRAVIFSLTARVA